MQIVPVACLSDNYAYLVICTKTGAMALVDASETEPVAKAVVASRKKLQAIWSTHHHVDHVGANDDIAKQFEVSDTFGHVSDRGRIPGQTKFLDDGATFTLGELEVRAMHIPGHTLGALAYVVKGAKSQAVFTGDTLFLGGCGRLFEGTPAQMNASLQSLMTLAPTTQVYCGHEYTESNLRFAHHVEPSNAAVVERQIRVKELRAQGKPTVPGTLADEQATNPFVRTASTEIRATLKIPIDADGATALAAIRKAKDEFR